MGKKPKNQSEGLVPTFILPWSRDKVSKNTEFLKKILQLIKLLIPGNETCQANVQASGLQ